MKTRFNSVSILLLMCIQNLVKLHPFVVNILSGNKVLTTIKGGSSVTNLQKMRINNPNKDHVNINVHTKLGQILSICSQDIERKRNSDSYQGQLLYYKFAKNNS